MAIRVIPIDDETFDRLIALRDEGVPAVAADAWPPTTDTFSIQIAGSAEYADATWQLDVERVGSHAAEFRIEQPYMVSPTTDPATGFAVWGDAGVIMAIDPGEVGEQGISVHNEPLPGSPDDPSFWAEMVDRILTSAYERPDGLDWGELGREPERAEGGDDDPGDDFEVDAGGATWRVDVGWHRYGTVRLALATAAPSTGAREVEAYAFAFSGRFMAQVAFDDEAAGQYGALAVPFEMSSNYDLHEVPSRLVDLARVMIAGLNGDLGRLIVMRREAGAPELRVGGR